MGENLGMCSPHEMCFLALLSIGYGKGIPIISTEQGAIENGIAETRGIIKVRIIKTEKKTKIKVQRLVE